MLEPDTRYLLIDSLRPAPGYELDMAVGTSFTLNLHTLMTVPVAFAMFDQQGEDGSLTEDSIATLQALRESAGRITLFSQAGQTAVPKEYRSIFVYLEDSIYPVVPPDPNAIFHPKVWYLRYRSKIDRQPRYRLLCLSRNLTFDRSWDTVLRLDGTATDERRAPELERFTNSLLSMADTTRPVPEDRASEIRRLGEEFSRVHWELPDDFDDVQFWPLGDDGTHRSPFRNSYERILIVSPFLTQQPIDRLTKWPKIDRSIVLSRPESFELLGARGTDHLDERLVLASDTTALDDLAEEHDPPSEESLAESIRTNLKGLHAKLYVMDESERSRILTGSANATWPGFNSNVEFLVELSGPTEHCGVNATIGDQDDRLGLRALVEPFDPPNDEAGELSEEQQANFKLDRASRLLAGLRYTAECELIEDARWQLSLEGQGRPETDLGLDEITVHIRPITLRMEPEAPAIIDQQLNANFEVSEEAVTPYFAFALSTGTNSTTFLVTAELLNPPPDREANVLRDLLKHPQDFIRLLLLLLGNIDEALATFEKDETSGIVSGKWLAGFGSDALLEPLVHAFARDPQRLRDIERLLEDLKNQSKDESVLPEGWREIWAPIAEALERDVQR